MQQPDRQAGPTGRPDTPGNDQTPRQGFLRRYLPWLILPAIVFWLIFLVWQPNAGANGISVSYSLFIQQVEAKNVASVTLNDNAVTGTFKTPVHSDQTNDTGRRFNTTIPNLPSEQTVPLLQQNGVKVQVKDNSNSGFLLGLIFQFLPILLLIGGIWYLSRRASQAQGGIFSFGQSRARVYMGGKTKTTFADVAGVDEAKADLEEVVDFLKNPQRYSRLGGKLPKGVLLVGPPGTGKTLLAKAVAGEADVPFFSMSGSEFVEMLVGVGASRVRDLFDRAKKAAPCIVFIDELDAVGRQRGAGLGGGNDEREQTLNQILVEMDGFDSREAVIVLAATNRADVLDPALLRPGRFDRRVAVQPPDRAGRAEILKVHTRGVPLGPDVDLSSIAGETPGLVGADLRNLVNEAALLAARKGHDAVTAEDFAEALEKIALGAERRLTLLPEERERIAYHESGHALLGLLQPESDPVRRVTVVPRGQALGVTLSVPEADRYNYSEPYLRARIVNALGGRAAEQLVYDSVTTGAENDLKQVTDVARAMVTRWGMSQEVGLLALSGSEDGNFLEQSPVGGAARPYSEETARAIDVATKRIVDESYAKAIDLLRSNRERLDALAQALLREESLNEEQMREVTGLPQRPADENAVGARR